jgi:nucleoside-triphosphatase THEP1
MVYGDSMAKNPYDPNKPYNSFVGRKNLIKKILQSVKCQNSVAILGGSKIGKTSILEKIRDEIRQQNGSKCKTYACLIRMDIINSSSEEAIYQKIIELLSSETGYNSSSFISWLLNKERSIFTSRFINKDPSDPYDIFKKKIKCIIETTKKKLKEKDLNIVIMIDKIGNADLPQNSKFYCCLRDFFSQSNYYSTHCTLVATGGREFKDLIQDTSKLSFLENKYLEVLNTEDAMELINIGFSSKSDDFKNEIINITGGHPFLMQGIMSKLFMNHRQTIIESKDMFFYENNVENIFDNWLETLTDSQKELYYKLTNNCEDYPKNHDLQVLKYYGVISCSKQYDQDIMNYSVDNDHKEIKISCTIFKDWFFNNYPPKKNNHDAKLITRTEQQSIEHEKRIKVFIGSSAELEEERELLTKIIYKKSNELFDQNYFIKPVTWKKDVPQGITDKPFQDNINLELIECQIALFLFWKKVGKCTKKELDLSIENCKLKKNPKIILVFFKNEIDLNSIGLPFVEVIKLKDKFNKDDMLVNLIFKSNEDLERQLECQLNLIIKDREKRVHE